MADTNQTSTCPICMELIEIKDNAGLCCRHDLHLSCVLELHSPTCPICRRKLKSNKLCEEDLQKMVVKHNEDVEDFDDDLDEEEEERYLEFLEDFRWRRELWYAYCANVGLVFKEKAKDFLKETGLEDILRLSRTEDGIPIKEEYPREVKFLAYLRLFGGVDDFETRCKIFALMDEGDNVFFSFLRDKPLVVDENFLHELSYQIYLTAFGEEDNFEMRCDARPSNGQEEIYVYHSYDDFLHTKKGEYPPTSKIHSRYVNR